VAAFQSFYPWVFLILFRVSLLVRGFLGLLGGVVVFTALSVALEVLRVMGDMGVVLNAISVSLVGGRLTIRQAPYSTILG
jgi:hypothetical protein